MAGQKPIFLIDDKQILFNRHNASVKRSVALKTALDNQEQQKIAKDNTYFKNFAIYAAAKESFKNKDGIYKVFFGFCRDISTIPASAGNIFEKSDSEKNRLINSIPQLKSDRTEALKNLQTYFAAFCGPTLSKTIKDTDLKLVDLNVLDDWFKEKNTDVSLIKYGFTVTYSIGLKK